MIKYNFPRKRNLPNRVSCFDETGKIECVFFNSYEGYIRKILPIGKTVIVSGKISFLEIIIKLQIQRIFQMMKTLF